MMPEQVWHSCAADRTHVERSSSQSPQPKFIGGMETSCRESLLPESLVSRRAGSAWLGGRTCSHL
eukprot:364692-Chlamydomonas_euryale.AAC.2